MVKELHGGEKDAKSPALLTHRAPRRSINLCKISKPVSSISFEVWLSRCCIKSSALPGMSQRVTLTATCTAGSSILWMLRHPPASCACDSSWELKSKSYGVTPCSPAGKHCQAEAGHSTRHRIRGMVLSGIQAGKKREQNQLLHGKGPRKSQGIEMHCFRLY